MRSHPVCTWTTQQHRRWPVSERQRLNCLCDCRRHAVASPPSTCWQRHLLVDTGCTSQSAGGREEQQAAAAHTAMAAQRPQLSNSMHGNHHEHTGSLHPHRRSTRQQARLHSSPPAQTPSNPSSPLLACRADGLFCQLLQCHEQRAATISAVHSHAYGRGKPSVLHELHLQPCVPLRSSSLRAVSESIAHEPCQRDIQ